MDNTARNIASLIEKYQALPKDYSDAVDLVHRRKWLSTLLFQFSDQVGDLYQEMVSSEYRRKSKYEAQRTKYINEGDTAAAADAKARADIGEEMKLEMMCTGIYKKADLLRQAAYAVLDSLNQQISLVKQEKRLEYTGQGSQ